MSEYNMTHTGKELDDAINKVKSGYINAAGTQNYTTQFKSDVFSVSSDTLVSNVSIPVGFKPKIFVIRANAGITSTSSRYYITTSWVVTDNNYEHILSKPDGSADARSAGSIGFYYSSNSARSAQSNSINNSLQVTDNGVKGNGSTGSSYYFKANTTYFWFAWG